MQFQNQMLQKSCLAKFVFTKFVENLSVQINEVIKKVSALKVIDVKSQSY